MVTPQGLPDFGPVMFPDAFAAVGLQAHDEFAELDFRWIGHEEMRMVLVGLELLQFAFEAFADLRNVSPSSFVTLGDITLRRYLVTRTMWACNS